MNTIVHETGPRMQAHASIRTPIWNRFYNNLSIAEKSRTEHDDSKLYDEPKMDEIQGNQTCRPNEGGSPPKSQNPDLEDEDELSRLKALATDVREQVDLERDVGRQVC